MKRFKFEINGVVWNGTATVSEPDANGHRRCELADVKGYDLQGDAVDFDEGSDSHDEIIALLIRGLTPSEPGS